MSEYEEYDEDQSVLDAKLFNAVLKSVDATKVALAHGADPNAIIGGRTPIFHLIDAASNVPDQSRSLILRALIEGGADPHEKGTLGDMEDGESATALHRVVVKRWNLCAKALLEAGADPTTQDSSGSTPFDEIGNSFGQHPESVAASLRLAKTLMAGGAEINAEGGYEAPPLILALANLNEPMVMGLLDLGARSDCRDAHGNGPLHALARGSFSGYSINPFVDDKVDVMTRLACVFMGRGEDPRRKNRYDNSALDIATGAMKATMLAWAERLDLGEQSSVKEGAESKSRPRI